MKKKCAIGPAACSIAFLCALLVSSPAVGAEGDASPNWGEAGREVKEAAKAVGEASKETWQLTKQKTAEAWRETKETTAEAVRKAKKKIHEATAPKTSPQGPGSGSEETGPAPGPEAPESQAPEPQAPAPVPPENGQISGNAGRQAI